jgi:hypothetical protein
VCVCVCVYVWERDTLLTLRYKVFLYMLIVIQLVEKFLAFCGTRGFITMFSIALQWFLSWTRWINATPHPIYIRTNLILSVHPHLGLPSGLFHSGFPTKMLYKFFIAPIRATWPAYLILLDLIALIIFGVGYKLLMKPLIMQSSPSLCVLFVLIIILPCTPTPLK